MKKTSFEKKVVRPITRPGSESCKNDGHALRKNTNQLWKAAPFLPTHVEFFSIAKRVRLLSCKIIFAATVS